MQPPPPLNPKAQNTQELNLAEQLMIWGSYVLVILTLPISLFLIFGVLINYERALIFRLGRSKKDNIKGPGVYFYLPCVDELIEIDLRTVVREIPPQDVLTKDSVNIGGTVIVFYRVKDPYLAAMTVNNYHIATFMVASTTFRNLLAQKTLREILSSKEILSDELEVQIGVAARVWGVEIEVLEIKDIILPLVLVRSMASEAEAYREKLAKIIKADGEVNSSEALKKASDLMSSSFITLQLRYLQTLTDIASEQNSTIIFPIPLEIG